MKHNSLIIIVTITVRSSEDKVVADEGASTHMSVCGLHWGHEQHRVLRDFHPIYDFSSKCCKDHLKSKSKMSH